VKLRSTVARFFVALFALVAIVLGSARIARANDDEPAPPPRDVPVIVQPAGVRLPALPSDFETREVGWVTIAYPASVRERAESVARAVQDEKAHLADELGQAVLAHVDVRIARDPEQMAALAPADAPPPHYAVGVAYPALHLVILSLQVPDTYQAPDLEEVFRHELSHVALEDAVADRHVPTWFDEGLAIHESGEKGWDRTKTLWDATLSKRVLPLSELDRGFPIDKYEVNVAYAESADFVRFLMRDSDRVRFGSLVERVRGGTPFDRALGDAYGTDLRKLEYEWREQNAQRFGITPILTGGSVLWVLVAGLMVIGWRRRRKQAKAKLAQWAREEAELDAAIAAARAREQAVLPGQEPAHEDPASRPAPGLPVVEHQGRWHTLH
jgi:hypothetical protein